MARIDKAEHPRILRMVDGEHRKVAEVAAVYGCTAANIYALLAKLRRGGAVPVPEAAPAQPVPASPVPAAADLFEVTPQPPDPPISLPVVSPRPASPRPASPPPVSPPPVSPRASPPPPPKPVVAKPVVAEPAPRGGVKGRAALAKPGFGLVMRTPEGEEGLTPFRSLEDLLSAVKPLLRAAARSPEPVWFSIQTIDLAALDSDAA